MLPDEILLAIFYFCVVEKTYYYSPTKKGVESWQRLVHVCQRWRGVVFGSPRLLNLQLFCTAAGTPVLETMDDVWPALPLIIRCDGGNPISGIGRDNILAVLKRSERIRSIHIVSDEGLPLEEVFALMQVPFPELTDLRLRVVEEPFLPMTALPDSFLNGSAPRLQTLHLNSIPISSPGLPKLLLSATHLVQLWLQHIRYHGYISPEMMVNCLSTSTSLESLKIDFDYTPSYPAQENQTLHLSTRSVLPALTYFSYRGRNEYLDDFVSRIDAPRLNVLKIVNESHNDLPQLAQFARRTPSIRMLKYNGNYEITI
jgi:hypothetical protein